MPEPPHLGASAQPMAAYISKGNRLATTKRTVDGMCPTRALEFRKTRITFSIALLNSAFHLNRGKKWLGMKLLMSW